MHGPRLTINWNSGQRYVACTNAEWSVKQPGYGPHKLRSLVSILRCSSAYGTLHKPKAYKKLYFKLHAF
jgi:hypothetical protein